MKTFKFKDKIYEIDSHNFLIDSVAWDENFAEGMAYELGMNDGLTEPHWEMIHFIRNRFAETGACPVVHETTHALDLNAKSLQQLFPTGYLRGACLLAGITYKYGWVYYSEEPYPVNSSIKHEKEPRIQLKDKVYRVDIFGSLVDIDGWDEDFAIRRAYEMNIKTGLTDKHWEIIYFLRKSFIQNKKIPTVYQCCEANQIDIEDLATLFPGGYHRGAVKIAGLPTFGWESL